MWICWVLRTLFSIPNRHPMAFKGGTSLSKVYGIIDRFSEDLDITLDYRFFNDDFDPFGSASARPGSSVSATGSRPTSSATPVTSWRLLSA